MTVTTSTSGPVLTVTIDRPQARNAVNPVTALALRQAFEAFEADESLSRRHPHRRRRDLLRRLRPQSRRVCQRPLRSRWSRPDGAEPHGAVKAGHRRHRGACRRRWPRTGAVVRHAGGERERGVRRVLPPLGRAADRWRHGALAAHHRPGACHGHDPHRPPGRGSRRHWPGASPIASCQREPRWLLRRRWPPISRAFRRSACAPTVPRRWRNGMCRWPRRCSPKPMAGWVRSAPKRWQAHRASSAAPAAAAISEIADENGFRRRR